MSGSVGQYCATNLTLPFNTSGIYLTGLSTQTTLQLNVKLIIEVAPGPLDQFATLASESPQYEPAALELYSQVVSKLPPAVPADMNPAGEYFKQVLGYIGDAVRMGSVIHPAFGLVGSGVKAVGMAAPAVERMVTNLLNQRQSVPVR